MYFFKHSPFKRGPKQKKSEVTVSSSFGNSAVIALLKSTAFPPFLKEDSCLWEFLRSFLNELRAIFIPNNVNCCNFLIIHDIFKNPNSRQKTKVEDLFTEIPNCFHKNGKTSP